MHISVTEQRILKQSSQPCTLQSST